MYLGDVKFTPNSKITTICWPTVYTRLSYIPYFKKNPDPDPGLSQAALLQKLISKSNESANLLCEICSPSLTLEGALRQ